MRASTSVRPTSGPTSGADGTTVGASRRSTPRGPTGIDVTEGVLRTLRDACGEADVDPRADRSRRSARSVRSISRRNGDRSGQLAGLDRSTGPIAKLIDSDDVSSTTTPLRASSASGFTPPATPTTWSTSPSPRDRCRRLLRRPDHDPAGNAGDSIRRRPRGRLTCGAP